MTLNLFDAILASMLSGRRGAARLQVALGVAGPAVVAVLLPWPSALLREMAEGTDAVAALQAAMLLAVTAIVWGLLAWAAVVGVATALAKAPGAAGRAGRSLLRAVAPATTRRIIVVATGVSLIAGTAACGTAAGTEPPHGSAPVASVVTTTVADTVAPTGAHSAAIAGPAARKGTGPAYQDGGYAGPDGRIDLDWPLSEPTATDAPSDDADAAAAPPTSSTPATTSPPATSTQGPKSATPSMPVAPHPSGTAAPQPSHPKHTKHQPPSSQPPNQAAPSDPAPSTTPSNTAAPNHQPPDHPQSNHPARTSPAPTSPAGKSPAGKSPAPKVPAPPAQSPTATRQTADGHVTVRAGDSLWSIAAKHLPAGATAAQIDAAWRAWYRANRQVIGGDPDLILPGQHLAVPHQEGPSR